MVPVGLAQLNSEMSDVRPLHLHFTFTFSGQIAAEVFWCKTSYLGAAVSVRVRKYLIKWSRPTASKLSSLGELTVHW